MKHLPRHLQGKTRMPLAGGCFKPGYRLALISLLPTLEVRPGERDDGENALLKLYQEQLLKAGQPPAFALHEPSLYAWGSFCKGRRSGHLKDEGVERAHEALGEYAFARAIAAVLDKKQTN